jgi:hypothetical protein
MYGAELLVFGGVIDVLYWEIAIVEQFRDSEKCI